jgi:L-asparaginase II
MVSLREAMALHPDLVAGEGRACTELMRAMDGKVIIKTGAEGVFVAIIPGAKIGIAVKATCGTTRAAEAIIATLLVYLGHLDPAHPAALRRIGGDIKNWRGTKTGELRTVEGFPL